MQEKLSDQECMEVCGMHIPKWGVIKANFYYLIVHI